MDGNKDDALKCLRIGKHALESGDHSRALKFLTKAQRLDPSLEIESLLSSINKDSNFSSATSSNQSGKAQNSSPKHPNKAPPTRSSSSATSATYSEEQIKIVREIKKKKDFYDILGVEKNCSVEDVRKAYRKLSLKVHPDKNKAPGSDEAFKVVSKAFQCLSNEESRKKYDVTGSDEEIVYRNPQNHHHHHGFNGFNGYHDDFDPDEIFRQFFFGGTQPRTTHFRTFNFGNGMGGGNRMNNDNAGSAGFNLRAMIQILPVLLILLLNFLPSSEPVYSLSRAYPYEYRFTTQRGVNYYVKSSKFEENYSPGSEERIALENKVDREYAGLLRQNCGYELQRQQWGFIRETPHCELFQQFQAKVAAT